MPKIIYENYIINPHSLIVSRFYPENKTDKLAKAIILFCQSIGYWHSFSPNDLINFCAITGAKTADLNSLLYQGYILTDKYKRHCITTKFINKYYELNV